jgi:F-type H+-transporting ATPase subunit alpha
MALINNLFDSVPLPKMKEAEMALRRKASELPEELCQGFVTTTDFSESDRQIVLQLAETALEPFMAKS